MITSTLIETHTATMIPHYKLNCYNLKTDIISTLNTKTLISQQTYVF